MIIALVDMTLPGGHEAGTDPNAARSGDATAGLPRCLGGVFQEAGRCRLAIMEAAAERPVLSFNVVAEMRDLAWW